MIAPPMGGSFGAKTFVRLEALVAALARKAGKPVKAVLDRAEEFVTLNRHPAVVRVRIGARRDGTLVAKEVDCWVDTGALRRLRARASRRRWATPASGRTGSRTCAWTRWRSTPTCRPTAPSAATARCSRCGRPSARWTCSPRELDMSPLELRRMNLLHDGDVFATGEVMHDVHFEDCLQAAADAVGYEADPRGKGLCVLLKGMQTPSRAAISVERTPVGYIVRSASCEMGQGVRRSLKLMGAELLGCEPGQVEVPDPDTDSSPYDTRTTSSRSTHMMGRALREAVARPRARRRARLRRGRATRAASIPTPARASPPRTGTRAPRPRT